MLARKLVRDLLRTKAQVGAVTVTIVLGVALFAGSWDAFNNLGASYERTYERLAFADFWVSGADAVQTSAAVARVEGVEAVTVRSIADVAIQPRVGHRLLGRIVGMPPDRQPAVNQIDVVEGRYLDGARPDAVVVDKNFAEHFDLSIGDVLVVAGERREIIGIATSPEYIIPSRSRQDLFATPDDFGVVFALNRLVDRVGGDQVTREVTVRYDTTVDAVQLDATVEGVARVAGATSWYSRAEQPSNAGLRTDLKGFEELSIAFPVLFLTAAGMATFVLLTRIVGRERSVIGTLLANGLDRRSVLSHYLSYGAVVGLGGAALGALLGIPLARVVTRLYTSFLSIPDTVVEFRLSTLAIALGFGLVTGLVAVLVPARSAFRLAPAEAMRGEVPGGRARISIVEQIAPRTGSLPARWRMQIRGIGRNKRRSLSTVLGVVLALVLILASWGMIDTTTILVDRQFTQVQREDAQLWLHAPIDADRMNTIASTPGVERAEAVTTLLVNVSSDDEVYATVLNAYEPDTQMHGFRRSSGGLMDLPSEGLVAGSALAGQLGVSRGDTVRVGIGALDTSFEVEIADFVDEAFGTLVYMSRDALAAEFDDPATIDLPGIGTSMVRYVDGVDRETMRARLSALPDVAAFSDSRSIFDLIQDSLALFYVFVGVMLVFGAAMAFALMFNTMSVNISERSVELATLRANGLDRRRLARMITAENVFLAAIGIAPGLVGGYYASAVFLDGFSSDLFQFEATFRGSTFVLASAAILVVALVSQWPGLRALQRQSIAGVVRERSV